MTHNKFKIHEKKHKLWNYLKIKLYIYRTKCDFEFFGVGLSTEKISMGSKNFPLLNLPTFCLKSMFRKFIKIEKKAIMKSFKLYCF
jgi:hypothetical protein